MKLICATIFVLLFSNAHAQQTFQGSVVYEVRVPQEKGTAPELTVLYGPNKIKVKFREKEDYDKTYLLVDLDSGKFLIVNTKEKTFQTKKLAELPEFPANPKIIAGYTTTPVNVTSSTGIGSIFGFAGTTTFFAASDLYYPVPKKYAGIPELVMIQNNHVVLGAEIKMGYGGISEDIPDSLVNKMKAIIEAREVKPGNFDLAEFSIPADFVKENMFDRTDVNTYADTLAMIDTVAVMPDTLAIPPPAKTNSKPKPKPSAPKKVTPIKSEAIKPKKTQTKS